MPTGSCSAWENAERRVQQISSPGSQFATGEQQTCKLPRLQSSSTIQVSIMRRCPDGVEGLLSLPMPFMPFLSSIRSRSAMVDCRLPCNLGQYQNQHQHIIDLNIIEHI